MAKEVFGKVIKLDDFYVLVTYIDVIEVHVVESIDQYFTLCLGVPLVQAV